MESAIAYGIYTDRLVLDEETKQMDEIYGISEGRRQTLTLNRDNTFSFSYDYYYQSEGAMYNLLSQVIHNITIKGPIHVQSSGVWVCNISEGKYQNDTLEEKDSGDQLTGRFKITALPKSIVQISEARATRGDGKPSPFVINKLEGMKMQRQHE